MKGILQTKNGRPNYYIVLDYTEESTGKRKRKWLPTDIPITGNNKRLANAKLKEVLAEYESQKVDFGKDVLFVGFMQNWLENLKHAVAPTTYDGYSRILSSHIIPYFEPRKLRVRDLSPVHIQQYVAIKMKVISPNTVIKHLRNISKCLDSAVRQNIVAFNPAKRIDMPRKIKYTGAKFYNEKQIARLLECSKGDPLEIVILLTVFYGLRRSEVLGLRYDAVDMENNTITIKHTVTDVCNVVHKADATKNDSSYAVIPLPNKVKTELLRWRAKQLEHKALQPNDYVDEGYICTQMDGSLIKPHYVSEHFKRLLAKNNMPHIRFHDLRHSAAGFLKYLGFDLKDIQTWLRHGDIGTTMNIYVNLDLEAKRNIAENLDRRFANFGS
jgi:integrase